MPRRKGGLWLPLDVNFMDDDRIVAAGQKPGPGWLYLAMCLASKKLGTDGMLTARQMDRLHIPGWRKHLVPLLATELVADLGGDLWGIRAWLRHNDLQAKLDENRAKDRDRKRTDLPSGIRPESVPTPDVEKSREEKRRETGPSGLVAEDCEHGVDRHASCTQCARSRRAVGDA